MKITQLPMLMIVLLCCAGSGMAQLNDIKIGTCPASTAAVETLVTTEKNKSLVLDARPFAINQATGKLLFTRGGGRVTVVHMNPFIYNYKISVAHQELISTAATDFLKLLLPPSLSPLVGTQSGRADKNQLGVAPSGLRMLEQRLDMFDVDICKAQTGADAAACEAVGEMARVFREIKASMNPLSPTVSPLFATLDDSEITFSTVGVAPEVTNAYFVEYSTALTELRNEELDTYNVCVKAQALNTRLHGVNFDTYFRDLNTAQQEISRITSLATELIQLTSAYNGDNDLKDKPARCNGLKCVTQFLAYANEIRAVLGGQGYQRKLDDLRNKGQDMQNMYLFTQQLKKKDGMFARTFPIEKKFELSQATITLKRLKLKTEADDKANTARGGTQSGTATPGDTSDTSGGGTGGGSGSEGNFGNQFGKFVSPDPQDGNGEQQSGTAEDKAKTDAKEGEEKPGNANALAAGDVNEVVQLGRPRLMLSGGLVYSPLARRTFKPVKGFVLDAQGNPTGNGDANVVGFNQNSSRRLFPMLFLNSRLWDYEQGSVFFSFGITGKKDDNVDLEYLFGPSFSFLNDRALFTVGAYGGMTQNLVNGVRVGDAIPSSLGDAEFYTKRMTWKPGFSFSYSFSRTKKGERTFGEGKTSKADELKDEIRIGSVPFHLALGLTFTSLEQRTYNEIAGFARDRQGNLTNGETLTRIVGLTSSSNYRLTPMAMLHTRLTDFGPRDFYFTTGLTGKKTDNDFDLEYLLGGSVNIYRRKVFLTFGTFIGKQQILGGSFFEGAALGTSQNVTTENRYVWKPAFSFSYDISRIIPRPN
jgi:hypothetical protein